jgi:RES domain
VRVFRVFDWDGAATGRGDGGPLFVARDRQGAGRHDAPALYGAWYCSRVAMAAVAESIQAWRGHRLDDRDFARLDGRHKALVELDLDERLVLVDLDDPAELARRRLRPSRVATRQRRVTQATAASIFRAGAGGIAWWSTLNADWGHVTLFFERAVRSATLAAAPVRLSTALTPVRQAADELGIRL